MTVDYAAYAYNYSSCYTGKFYYFAKVLFVQGLNLASI